MINTDVDSFSEEQRKFLSNLVSDFDGPTSSSTLLYIIESLLYSLKSDWMLSNNVTSDEQLNSDLEVCLAALQYYKVKNASEK